MSQPLATLIAARMAELDLTPHTLAVRLGYRNTNKGSRRVQALLGGRHGGQAELLSRLTAALDLPPDAIAQAVYAGDEAQERSRRDAFVPHAVLVTERTVPSQVTLCAVTNGERALRVSLDTTQPRASWAGQVLREVNRRTEGGRTGARLRRELRLVPGDALRLTGPGTRTAGEGGSDRRHGMARALTRPNPCLARACGAPCHRNWPLGVGLLRSRRWQEQTLAGDYFRPKSVMMRPVA